MADQRRRLDEERDGRAQLFREFDLALPRHRTDRGATVVDLDPAQLLEAAEVDERLWPREPEVHQRHQALTTGEERALAAVLVEVCERLFEARGLEISERAGLHAKQR